MAIEDKEFERQLLLKKGLKHFSIKCGELESEKQELEYLLELEKEKVKTKDLYNERLTLRLQEMIALAKDCPSETEKLKEASVNKDKQLKNQKKTIEDLRERLRILNKE